MNINRRDFLVRAGGALAFAKASSIDARSNLAHSTDTATMGGMSSKNRSSDAEAVLPTASGTAYLTAHIAHDVDLRSNPAVLAYVEFKDVETVRADLARSNWADSSHRAWCAPRHLSNGQHFCADFPEFLEDHGLSFMRFGGTRDIMAAHLFAPPALRHAFARYVLILDVDVPLYMTELGVKLPGLAGTYSDTIIHTPHSGTKTFSWRMEHGPKNDLSVRDYLYDATSGRGYGNVREYGAMFIPGRPFVIEQELDVDANRGRVWINDVFVGDRIVVTDVDIEELFLNVYHGGMGFATQPIHYRIAAACLARKRIGAPPELSGKLSNPMPGPPSVLEPHLPPAPTWIKRM